MRLIKITLNNFRQFKGENSIEFPSDGGILVVHGENGFGKTASTVMISHRAEIVKKGSIRRDWYEIKRDWVYSLKKGCEQW